VLDCNADQELSDFMHRVIDRHLAACRVCRNELRTWQQLAALPVPNTPESLRKRVPEFARRYIHDLKAETGVDVVKEEGTQKE
jgi:anti-sigma factor RsiW